MNPSALQIWTNLTALLRAEINAVLEAMGARPLSPAAFPDEAPIDPSSDTIFAAWSGTRREEADWAHRDQAEVFTLNVWAAGGGAMQRAMQLAAAVVAVIDKDEQERKQGGLDTYLDGACTQPPSVGSTRCFTEADADAPNMTWHLGIPILCPTRTTRPEIAAGD